MHSISLNDVEKPTDGFIAEDLKSFLSDFEPDLIWIHGEPLQQTTRDICGWYKTQDKPYIFQAAITNYHHLGEGRQADINSRMLRRVTGFLAVSESTATAVNQGLGISSDRITLTYLPNIKIVPNSKNGAGLGFRIGFAGRLTKRKGIYVLLDALKLLPDNAILYTAGNGEREIVDCLENSPKVRHLGLLPDLKQLFSKIDLLVVPSLTTPKWKEQFGRVIAEAFACGIPVVGSSSGSIPDVVGDGGLVYAENSSREMAEKIKMILGDESKYQSFSGAAIRRFENYFSVEAHARSLGKIFNLEKAN